MVDTKKEKESIRQAQDRGPIGVVGRERAPEEFPTVESPRKVEEPLEVESWIEKIEKRFARVPQDNNIQDDTVVVTQPQSNQPPVTLPVTQQQINDNHNGKPEFSLTWLVTWAIRQIKMLTLVGRHIRLQDLPEADKKK